MHTLYDSDTFVVLHIQTGGHGAAHDPQTTQADAHDDKPQLVRHGFEIVDKRSGKEVYLDGSWAEMFQQQILAWQRETPTQQEIEDALDLYSGLAQNPVVIH